MNAEWEAMSKFSKELEKEAKRYTNPKFFVSPPVYDMLDGERVLVVTLAWRDGQYGHYLKFWEPITDIDKIFETMLLHWELCQPYFEEN